MIRKFDHRPIHCVLITLEDTCRSVVAYLISVIDISQIRPCIDTGNIKQFRTLSHLL